jgi:hypothetical protein
MFVNSVIRARPCVLKGAATFLHPSNYVAAAAGRRGHILKKRLKSGAALLGVGRYLSGRDSQVFSSSSLEFYSCSILDSW